MDLELKHKIAEKIIQSDDENLLEEIKSLVGLSEEDFWNDIPSEVKSSIEKAIDQLNRGEGKSHGDVMNEIKNRFRI